MYCFQEAEGKDSSLWARPSSSLYPAPEIHIYCINILLHFLYPWLSSSLCSLPPFLFLILCDVSSLCLPPFLSPPPSAFLLSLYFPFISFFLLLYILSLKTDSFSIPMYYNNPAIKYSDFSNCPVSFYNRKASIIPYIQLLCLVSWE